MAKEEKKHIINRLKKAGKITAITLAATTTISSCGLLLTIYNSLNPKIENDTKPSYTQEAKNNYINITTYDEFNTYDNGANKIKIELNSYEHINLINQLLNSNYNFSMEQYYGLEEAIDKYNNTTINKSTETNLLNENNQLDSNKLLQTVQKNNEKCYENGKNSINVFYENLNQADMQKICNTIAEVVNKELNETDRKKLANTLNQLTMFKRTGTASNAYISNDLTFVYNPTMSENYSNIKEIEGQDPDKILKSVITHEIMHLIQYATSDNDNKNGIEAGICRMYNVPNQNKSIPVDSLWYSWLLEASAELRTADYLEIEPGTYKKKISYTNSYNLSRFNELTNENQSLENVLFNHTLEEAYKTLELETESEKEDFLKFMYSIEIIQSNANDFWEYYSSQTDKELTETDKLEIKMNIRTQAVKYMTGNFYKNLVNAIHENKINDLNTVFYLVRTWELDTYNHLEYTKENSLNHAQEYIMWHNEIQQQLFKAIANSNNLDIDTINAQYDEYNLQYKENNEIKDNCDLSSFNTYTSNFIITINENYSTANFTRNNDIYEYLTTEKKEIQQNNTSSTK